MNYLLDASELPGDGWTNSRQATLRSVRFPFQRSWHVPSVSASRNYRHGQPVRYIWIELTVANSPADASKLVERARTRYYRKRAVTLTAEREMTGYELAGVADAQLFVRERSGAPCMP